MERGRPVSARISDPEIDAIDRWAEAIGVSRSEMVRRLLGVAISRASQDDRILNLDESGVVLIARSVFKEMLAELDRHRATRRKIMQALLDKKEATADE